MLSFAFSQGARKEINAYWFLWHSGSLWGKWSLVAKLAGPTMNVAPDSHSYIVNSNACMVGPMIIIQTCKLSWESGHWQIEDVCEFWLQISPAPLINAAATTVVSALPANHRLFCSIGKHNVQKKLGINMCLLILASVCFNNDEGCSPFF